MMITIAICTYNRAATLGQTLSSLAAMRVPSELIWELIVVDNNSTDQTAAVVESFRGTFGQRLAYHHEKRQGLSYARNAAVSRARGDVVAFFDDDVTVCPDWLTAISRAFSEHDVACVGGRVLLAPDLPKPRWWLRDYDGMIGKFDGGEEAYIVSDPRGAMIGIGANLSFRRRMFDEVGLFRSELGRTYGSLQMGDDLELVGRVRQAGYATLYCPSALVFHFPDASRFTKSYLRRWNVRIGAWRFLLESQRSSGGPRILGVPRWKYRELASAALRFLAASALWRRTAAFRTELELIRTMGYVAAGIRFTWRRRGATGVE